MNNENNTATETKPKLTKSGKPKAVSAVVDVLGIKIKAIQHWESFYDFSDDPLGEPSILRPREWRPSRYVGIRKATLINMLRNEEFAGRARITHESEFSGMVDGRVDVPAERRVVHAERMIQWIEENGSSGLNITWHGDSQEITIGDYCDHFRIVDGFEVDRRAAELEAAPLPAIVDGDDVATERAGLSEGQIKAMTDARARFLAGCSPSEFDDAHAALCKVSNPLDVLRIVDREWLATLQRSRENRARTAAFSGRTTAA